MDAVAELSSLLLARDVCVFIWWAGMRSDDITHVMSGTDVSFPTATWQQGCEVVFF